MNTGSKNNDRLDGVPTTTETYNIVSVEMGVYGRVARGRQGGSSGREGIRNGCLTSLLTKFQEGRKLGWQS